ncbi:MAG: hypothetical protein PHE29_07795 [Tissierellia bacterium]|nr:hypothetical protein [Tissierellia bacterium]
MNKIKLVLSAYSKDNLRIIYSFTKAITDKIELEGNINRISMELILPIKQLGFDYDQSLLLVSTINNLSKQELIRVTNDEHYSELRGCENNLNAIGEHIKETEQINSSESNYDFLRYDLKSKLILQFFENSPEPFYQIQTAINNIINKDKQKKHNDRLSMDDKIRIFISNDKGIYINEDIKKPSYPIKKERLRLLKFLKDGKKDGTILAENLYKSNMSVLVSAISDINRIFKKTFNFKNSLIIKVDTGGYRLNISNYTIKFMD